MKVKITLMEEMLGTANANPDLHREFIASKSADADKVEAELAALHAEELEQKSLTVFPRDSDGMPMLWDYQFKGFIKESVGILVELLKKEVKVGKTKLTKFTHKRIVDNYIDVFPRKIRLECGMGAVCVRPLRADTMKGERVSLASSETVPAGTSFECEIVTDTPELEELVRQCLDRGKRKGLGQWRNSGKGRFEWEELAA